MNFPSGFEGSISSNRIYDTTQKARIILDINPCKIYKLITALSIVPQLRRDPDAEVFLAQTIHLPCTDNEFPLDYGNASLYSEILFNELNLISPGSLRFHIFEAKVNRLFSKVVNKRKEDEPVVDIKNIFHQNSFDLEFIKKILIGKMISPGLDNNNLIGLTIILFDRFMEKNPDMNTPEFQSMIAVTSLYLARAYLSESVAKQSVYLSKFPGLTMNSWQFTHCCAAFSAQVGPLDIEEDACLEKYFERTSHPFFSQVLDGSLSATNNEADVVQLDERALENILELASNPILDLENLNIEGLILSSPSYETVDSNALQGLNVEGVLLGSPTDHDYMQIDTDESIISVLNDNSNEKS